MASFLWPHFLHGTIGGTLELSLIKQAEKNFFDHLSGEEDFFLLVEGKLD